MRYRIRSALIAITVGILLECGPALAASDVCKADLNGDGFVNFRDLAVLKSVFYRQCKDPGPICGDGVAEFPEACDDGNLVSGDGCSSRCTIEVPPPPGPSYAFPATGQTKCWDAWNNVTSCTGTGQDGEIQAGAPLAYVDNGDGTVTDANTGLMWEKLDDSAGGIHHFQSSYTWANAFTVKIAELNASGGFAGHTDWRLPNRRELESIVNLGIGYPGPTVAAAFNTGCTPGCTVTSCSCTLPYYYWSSSTYAFSPGNAWVVYFYDGKVIAGYEPYLYCVRAVRGGL